MGKGKGAAEAEACYVMELAPEVEAGGSVGGEDGGCLCLCLILCGLAGIDHVVDLCVRM